jgi:hypothetical protein
MSIFYDKNTNAFYDSGINEIPVESVEITNELHFELLQKQSEGLVIQSDESGFPVALERTISNDEKIIRNKTEKQQLINEATRKISILQDIIDLDMQESDEEAQLKAWKKYRILVTRVDASDINAVFPKKP